MKLSLFLTFILLNASTQACDLCGCYISTLRAARSTDHGFQASVAEQFTHFGSIRIDGHEVADPSGQYLDSSITQLVVGQSFLRNRLLLQTNLPTIYRDYKRPDGDGVERGHESGFGDASLLASYEVFRHASQNDNPEEPTHQFLFTTRLNGGIKFPTGDAHRLSEEFAEGHEAEHADDAEHSHEAASGIHGHDLALGTGSYDALFGGEIYARMDRFFFEADAQFTLRGDGRYSYHYANDLTWSCGWGGYLLERRDASITLQAVVSGEYKDTDRFQGRVAEDTGITAVYLGPKIVASYKRVTAELGFDLPVLLDNTALQIVPAYRLRAAVSFHF
ncbi:MAG: hypothetical protein ABIT76_09855 [Chthoniobacterales bacterium]